MATQTPQPITHIYKEINKGKYKSVKHYELIVNQNTTILPNLLNISQNQRCAKSMPEFWLKVRQRNKWSKDITGLFKTSLKNIYKGDTQRRKNLLIFLFTEDGNTLVVKYFKNYFTSDLNNISQHIAE